MPVVPAVRCVLFSLAAAVTAQEPLPRDVLRGTVTDANGAPVAGATVEVHRRDAQGLNCLDLAHARTTRKVQTLRTGKNGSFAAQLPRGVPFELHLDDSVHAPIRRREVYAGEDIALQLAPAARVSCVLRDEAGKPCPGGTLEMWDAQHVRWLEGSIDDQGRWQSDRLPPGPVTFDFAPASACRPEWHKVTLEPGVTTPIELTLDAGCTLRGKVTDSATGQPIAGARIGEGWTMDKFVVTDADGRYEMRGYGAPGYGEVRVTAPGHGPALHRLEARAEGIAADFALEPGCEATGRVVDAAGKPVPSAYVAAVGGGFSGDDTHDWCSARTDAEGRYRLQGMRARIAHALMVRADGFAALVGDMPNVGPTPLQLPDVVMRACRYVSGVLVDGSGQPLPGVEIDLRGANSDRAGMLGSKNSVGANNADYCIAVRSMKTDSLGRIHFADVPAGTYQLTIASDRSQRSIAVEVVADKDPEPIRLEH